MILHIDPPLGGVDNRTGFQTEKPFTAHTILDMWPVDVDTGRAVLGVRSALDTIDSPGATVECLQNISGVRADGPKLSMMACSGSDIFWWDDTVWRYATGAQASAADTGRAVFSTSFLQQAFIFVDGAKPIVFDYPTGTAVTLEEHAGDAPAGCRGGFTWQGGIWLFGQDTAPHVLYGSRTGNALDWDFSAPIEDEGGAFFDLGTRWGGSPITAGFEQTSDTAIISALGGMVAYRGHPRRLGTPEVISKLYILGQGAWTKVPDDTVYAMTPRGLVMIDLRGNVLPVSSRAIPDDLVGLTYDYSDPTICVQYDSWLNAIHITDRQSGAEQSWTYFIDTSAFVKNTLSNYPFVLMEYLPFVTDDTSGVLFGRSA